jgi:hypothetical protein
MKRWTLAATILTVLTARASAAQQFKSGAYEQAADMASGAVVPSVYDGSITLPVLQKAAVPAPQTSVTPAAAVPTVAVPAVAAAAVPPAVVPAPSHLEEVPIPQGMEIAVVRRDSAPSPRRSARDLAAPLGAMIGLATGFSIGFALSKSLA